MKITTVVGARPQFVKAAPLSRVLRASPGVEERLVHTGQHYDDNMSRLFFEELAIPEPDVNLRIGSGCHGEQTGRMLAAIEQELRENRPDAVLVYGDTNSTLAGALAAAKLHVPVAHVEAGLRSFNRRMPEEINRVLTDHCADLLFAPTRRAVANLLGEGLPRERIYQVGDVMYDAALFYAERAERHSRILDKLGLAPRSYVLATIHRAENTDDAVRMRNLLCALAGLGGDVEVVLPLHPRTRKALEDRPVPGLPDRIRLIEPVGYLDMVMLERHARVIATDSGGVQKEAFFHGVPCVTLRGETEWTELVELGWNRLAPPLGEAAVREAIRTVWDAKEPPPQAQEQAPFGTGEASLAICSALLQANARRAPEPS